MSDKLTTVFMFFSGEACALMGYAKANVPDGGGGSERMFYTLIDTDPEAKAYRWKDKKLVWSGAERDVTNVRSFRKG